MNTVNQDIINAAPNCMISHYFCDKVLCTEHFTKCTSFIVCNDEYDWSVRFQCTECSEVWWLCHVCKLRKKLKSSHHLVNHNYTSHRGNNKP